MSDKTIDWSLAIEAYHEDGRVVAGSAGKPDGDGDREFDQSLDDRKMLFRPDGRGWSRSHRWRIRNVATQDIPEWAMERARELTESECASFPRLFRAFARYIADHEKAPADPDLLEARQIEYEICKAQDMFDPEQALRGEWDDKEGLQGVLRAIKRGRELERGGK